ncbi:protein kinase domain-containing protein [Purpureocillium lavendulum]|uniref:Protein kinase domain-containing protein n=1 Tax=Purpureocillium lavendulum TaxID=1247861 RepID=A0AB34FHH8_9HYPO|nr:protein kinase domain-containing protein [Purpureocillium lavendulum]
MDSQVKYLLSLRAIRERAKVVGEVAKAGRLSHFEVREDKLDDVVDFVASVIKRDFGPDKFHTIPPHGRWQHFEVGDVPRIAAVREEWTSEGCDNTEVTRRLIDLFFVSVLLDAGAGDHWRYTEPKTGHVYERSEGIAVASLDMFSALTFQTGEEGSIPMVTGKGLEQLDTSVLEKGFQVSKDNPMLGVDSRAALLRSLGRSLLAHPDVFGPQGRPGRLVDFLIKTAGGSTSLDTLILWDTLQDLLIPCWPKDRTTIGGMPIGDAWPLSILRNRTAANGPDAVAESIQPFHKLTQWLTYSLMVPFQRVLNMSWINTESLTALPEYRNGGLFVDMGVLSLKKETLDRGLKASGAELPLFEAGDDAVVEWRAMTLVLIDQLYDRIQPRMDKGVHLTMAQLLEAGTWNTKSAGCPNNDSIPDELDTPVCEMGKTQYFKHPDLGDLSVTFTEAGGINGNKEDGLHHPALQFKALNNWEQIRVQDIIDAHPGDTGNLCEKKKSNGGRTLEWTCGFPKLTKVSSSAFGINLMNPDSKGKGYAKGWCTAHVVQYQKNEFGTGSDYRFAVQIFDAKKNQIGHVQKAAVAKNRYLGVASKLPYKLVVKAGKVDSDPVSVCYGDQCWTCDENGGGRHGCTLGHGKDNGYENGDREGDMGFTC